MDLVKASSKRGQTLLSRASTNEGTTLAEIYGTYSTAKASSFAWCKNQYFASENHSNFRIISHNTFQFSVAWELTYGGARCTRIETAKKTYIVLLDL